MLNGDEEVSDLLGRVMSRAPAPDEQANARREAARKLEAALTRGLDPEWELQGIHGQTRVTTNFGKVPAQLIRVGDRVRTRDGLFHPVRKIREYKLDLEYVDRHPEALPVLIAQGALDGKYPTQDVLVSPKQLVRFDARRNRTQLLPADELPKSRRMVDTTLGLVAYYKFELDEAAELYCEGLWVSTATDRDATSPQRHAALSY